MKNKQTAPYGTWTSPIDAGLVAQRVRMEDVRWDSDGETLLWVEGRSGRGFLLARDGLGVVRELQHEHNVRGTVGYGGGEFCVRDHRVVFAARDGGLYATSTAGESPRRLTDAAFRAAGPELSPDGRWVVYVEQDGDEDRLSIADWTGALAAVPLARGADFYMQPAWSVDGKRLAWVEWDHPHMPWESARLMLAEIDGSPPQVVRVTHLAGGSGLTAVQPQFSPDGCWLSCIVSNDEWEDLVLIDLHNGRQQVLVHSAGFALAEPAWVQGGRSYAWEAEGRTLVGFRYRQGFAGLWRVNLAGEQEQISTAPYTWLTQITVPQRGRGLALLGSAPTRPACVLAAAPEGSQLTPVAQSLAVELEEEYFPSAEAAVWSTAAGQPVYGMYFAPRNAGFSGQGSPPVMVHIHGGPTSQSVADFDAERAYFTSRGWGWFDLNYRGSTGYGANYRRALNGQWGAADVEDALSVPAGLAQTLNVDVERMVIEGGSAGGFTVLNLLTRENQPYRAGVCQYPVADLFGLVADTHKFEAHYIDSLVGVLPRDEAVFRARSPFFHLERMRTPLALFHGQDDPVVPLSQSQAVAAVLEKQGVPFEFRVYAGEGHGFRQAASIADYLATVERFLARVVLKNA